MKVWKMTGYLYEDVEIVFEAICNLHSMVGYLEKECMVRDEGKSATELFILINGIQRDLTKLSAEAEKMTRKADIGRFGPLSKYVRPYLAF